MTTTGATTAGQQARHAVPRAPTRTILTREGERAIRAELEQLRDRAQNEFVERLREARDFGGASENDEYLQIKEEEAIVEARIRRLETLLESAKIVDEDDGARNVVAIGSLVELKNRRSGKVAKQRITGGFDPTNPDDISANSPVGQALLGRSAGDEVSVELPNGRTVRLEVLGIEGGRPTAQPDPA